MSTDMLAVEQEASAASVTQSPGDSGWQRLIVNACRILVVAVFLALWQYVPKIPGISHHVVWLDPFFISSPTRVAQRVWDVTTGVQGTATIWSALWFTIYTSLIGTLIAVALGAGIALLLSNSPAAELVFRPIVAAVNAVPRVAIVPIVVIIAKSPAGADITTAAAVVIGLVFYNSLEGGRSVPSEMVEGARLMGAKRRDVILRIRLPYVMAWVFASMPNAFAFGLVGSVTTEIFTGAPGVGHQLQLAVNTADATLTFAVVFLLTVVGAVLVQGTDFARRRLLPWWNA